MRHKINSEQAKQAIRQAPRRIPIHSFREVNAQVKKILKEDFIEPSNSLYASQGVLVRKKGGSVRFYVDYRRLNAVTTKDAYPLPKNDEAFDHFSGHEMFSILDFNSGRESVWKRVISQHCHRNTPTPRIVSV